MFEISQHMYKSFKVRDPRLLHELVEMLNSNSQIKPYISKEVELSTYFSVKRRVIKEFPIFCTHLLCAI